MTAESDLAFVMVVVIIVEGVWLAGLTYLMWRRYLKKPREKDKEEPPTQPA